jgi:hypothetical protein
MRYYSLFSLLFSMLNIANGMYHTILIGAAAITEQVTLQ